MSVALAIGCGTASGTSEVDPADEPSAAAGTSTDATPTDRAICEGLQGLVDKIVAGDADGSMRALHELELAVADGEPGTLRTAGEAFFATIYGTVPDPGSLTVEESVEVGADALRAAQPRLGAMLATCAELGLPIEDLPTSEGRP